MPKDECRESRPVIFSPHGIVWAAAAQGTLASVDVDGQGRLITPPASPAASPAGTAVSAGTEALLPFQRQQRPLRGGAVRTPLASANGNVEVVKGVLGAELRALERKAAYLERTVKAQELIIGGLCKLRVASAHVGDD